MGSRGENYAAGWDVTASSARVQDFLGGLSLDPKRFRDDALRQLQDLKATADADAVASESISYADALKQYGSITDIMAMLNEGANANLYISNALKKEGKRMGRLNKNTKKSIYGARWDYQYTAYMTEYYAFMTNVVMFTLVITLLVLLLTAAWRLERVPQVLYIALVGTLLLVYATSMILMFKNAAYRRKYSWNKYYWRPSQQIVSAVNSANMSGQDASCAETPY